MTSKLASETTQAIVSNLADRRGMPDDLEFGDDWKEAREKIASFVESAVSDAEAETCARIVTLLRRQRDEYREEAKKGGRTAHRMGEEMAAALIDGLANWVETLPSSGDWKRGGHG